MSKSKQSDYIKKYRVINKFKKADDKKINGDA